MHVAGREDVFKTTSPVSQVQFIYYVHCVCCTSTDLYLELITVTIL